MDMNRIRKADAGTLLRGLMCAFTLAFLIAAFFAPDLPQMFSGLGRICTLPAQLTKDYVRPGQIVIDVSINWDPEKINSKGGKGAIAGDAVYDEVEPIVEAITPVPGGVGSVTTSVLIGHVVEAAERKMAK